jgi:ribonuclease P protein component
MFVVASGSMDSGLVCAAARAGPSSNGGVRRDGSASLHSGRTFTSLRRRAHFRRVRQTGSRSEAGGIVLITALGEVGVTRVGIVVGRRLGGAVDRNRVKRRMREAVARTPLRRERDYIVIAKPGAATASVEDLVTWVTEAMES